MLIKFHPVRPWANAQAQPRKEALATAASPHGHRDALFADHLSLTLVPLQGLLIACCCNCCSCWPGPGRLVTTRWRQEQGLSGPGLEPRSGGISLVASLYLLLGWDFPVATWAMGEWNSHWITARPHSAQKCAHHTLCRTPWTGQGDANLSVTQVVTLLRLRMPRPSLRFVHTPCPLYPPSSLCWQVSLCPCCRGDAGLQTDDSRLATQKEPTCDYLSPHILFLTPKLRA